MTTSVTSSDQIHPMGDRVVIRPDEQPEVSTGGIYLPDTAKERPQEGEVVAAGPGDQEIWLLSPDSGAKAGMKIQ